MRNTIIALGATAAFALALAGCKDQPAKGGSVQPGARAVSGAARQPAAAASLPASRPVAASKPAAHALVGKVTETMTTAGYTYVLVDAGAKKIWAAAPEFQVSVGDRVAVPPGAPMQNYHSKTLNRTFDLVYFVAKVDVAGGAAAPQVEEGHGSPAPAAASAKVDFSGVAKAPGGQTVAEIFGGKATLSGKAVVVRGKVAKVNNGIMGKNWLHVQDGTGAAGSNDLVVTTKAVVNVGDTVLVKGTLVTDKDYGAGYKYAVIVEDADVKAQ